MSQVLRQSTQVIVRIGPAVAVGDGFTPVTTLTLAGADEAELLKANTTTTTDISGATMAAITGCDGWYGLTLTTSLTDTVGCLDVMINDDSLILPIFARFQVIEEAAYDAMYAASADPKADINVGSIDANAITAAATAADFGVEVAAAVWQDAVAGDFTVASSIGKALYTGNVVPGGAGGLMIAGSNAATTFATLTVTGATTLTGNVLLSDGLTVAAPSTGNRAGITITGNGTGAGIIATGGATGNGMTLTGGATSGSGLVAQANALGSGHGIRASNTGGANAGLSLTSMAVTTTTTLTGAVSLGATLAVTGNVTFSGAAGFAITNGITANITGNLSGSVGSVTGLTASNLDATISSVAAAVAALNDFDPATEEVLANVMKINSVTVTGTGTAGDLWRG